MTGRRRWSLDQLRGGLIHGEGTGLPGWSEFRQNVVVFWFCLSVSCIQMSLSDADLL